MADGDELRPYVVVYEHAGENRCALWQLAGGPLALALFLNAELADAYARGAGLAAAQVLCPERAPLLALLEQSYAAGVRWAVLDPTGDGAKRMFDLHAVLRDQGRLPAPPA